MKKSVARTKLSHSDLGNDGRGGGPVINNAEAGYDWSTYPERLERAGISWKIYQDSGVGLDAAGFWGWTDDAYIGNYGDNSLLYFHQYQNTSPGDPLYEKARRGTNIGAPGTPFDALFADLHHSHIVIFPAHDAARMQAARLHAGGVCACRAWGWT